MNSGRTGNSSKVMLCRLLALALCIGAATGSTTAACAADIDCDDGVACTLDSCDGTTGYCLIEPNSTIGACSATACVPKFCVGGSRAETPCARASDCPGGECSGYQCTGGAYDGTACLPVLSGPSNSTWSDWSPSSSAAEVWLFHFCEYGGGACESDPCYLGGEAQLANCNDGSQCTDDFCDPAAPLGNRCSHAAVNCSDGNACNGEEWCDAELGCMLGQPFMPTNCDDGIGCSLDICNATSGQCEHDYSACSECSSDPDCDDRNPHTDDYCVTGRCNFTGAPCSVDCLPCTAGDVCVPLAYGSCMHASLVCPSDEASEWSWPPMLAFAGLMALLSLCGAWAATTRLRRKEA